MKNKQKNILIAVIVTLSLLSLPLLYFFTPLKAKINYAIDEIFTHSPYSSSKKSNFTLEKFINVLKSLPTNPKHIDTEIAYVLNLKTNKVLYQKNASSPVTPASIEKLFTIYFANSIFTLNEKVSFGWPSLTLAQDDSSLAILQPGTYTVKDLYAAMLIPSGNDAANALAVAGGIKISKQELDAAEARNAFVNAANIFLKENKISHTTMSRPSGFSYTDTTSVSDIVSVCKEILKHQWFLEIIQSSHYSIKTPSSQEYSWENSNAFIDKNSKIYNPKVKGIKTGTLDNSDTYNKPEKSTFSGVPSRSNHQTIKQKVQIYNLVSLYQTKSDYYIVLTIHSPNNDSRYKDSKTLFKLIEEYELFKTRVAEI